MRFASTWSCIISGDSSPALAFTVSVRNSLLKLSQDVTRPVPLATSISWQFHERFRYTGPLKSIHVSSKPWQAAALLKILLHLKGSKFLRWNIFKKKLVIPQVSSLHDRCNPHTSPSSALPTRLGSYLSPRPWNAMPHPPRHTSLDPRVRNVHGLHGPRSEMLVVHPQLNTQIHGNMMLPKKIERLIISWSPKWHNACKITYPACPSYEKKNTNCECKICCPSVRIDVHTHGDRFTPRCDTRSTGNKLQVAELIRSMWAF